MPITKSAKKALRQNKKKGAENDRRKNKIKRLVKQAKRLIEQGKKDEAKKLLPEIYQALDKADKTKAIKKNTASRKKSRLSKLCNKQI